MRKELEEGTFPFRPELEDIHTNIERRLVELVAVGGKLHTGRSRNDQIALDERLYLKTVARADASLRRLQASLVARAEETVDAPMPGYTYLCNAPSLSFSLTICSRTCSCSSATANASSHRRPRRRAAAGSAALAGTAFPIDREALARDLGLRPCSQQP